MHVYSDAASGRHVNPTAAVEAPERFPAALAGVERAEDAGLPVERRSCEPASYEDLCRVHSPAYLNRLEKLSAAGGGTLNLDTSLGPESWEAATLASGAAVSAVDSALSGEAAFAVARPPGHHAGQSTGMGFCLLNHAAVAARHALSRGVGRVVVLDWDVHHGNGTQDLFYRDPDVLYLSIHQSPFYPGTGSAREVGEGRGEGYTANVPIPRGAGEEAFAAALERIFAPLLEEYRPELLLVSAGYDAHADDPLGGLQLTADSYERLAGSVAALTDTLGIPPPALVLEGGYSLSALTASVAATIRGLENRSGFPEAAREVRPVESARGKLSGFWKSLR